MEDRKGADRVAVLKNSGSRIYNWAHAWLGYKYSEDERPLETSIDIELDPTLNNSTLVLHQQINEMSTLFQTLTDNIGRMKDELNTLDQKNARYLFLCCLFSNFAQVVSSSCHRTAQKRQKKATPDIPR